MKLHEKYINRCIQISKNGGVLARPNPSVGAVIVFEDKIIGEGYTSVYGGHHAEVNAIRSVKNKNLLQKSTLYVSLEPCSHFGKTPPCSDLIVESKIPRVVVGMLDPNNKVAGKGILKMINAGIDVVVGVLEKECYDVNRFFFTFHQKMRPYIILKWAETTDGFIAPKVDLSLNVVRKPVWITNSISRQLAHKWRSEIDGILVGTQTVISDNPKLDVRDWFGTNPVRIILDQKERIPKKSYIFDNQIKTILINAESVNFENDIALGIIALLYENNIQSVLIEGGTKTIQAFIDAGIWDEARVFIGNAAFHAGVMAPDLKTQYFKKSKILDDELLIFRNHD